MKNSDGKKQKQKPEQQLVFFIKHCVQDGASFLSLCEMKTNMQNS